VSGSAESCQSWHHTRACVGEVSREGAKIRKGLRPHPRCLSHKRGAVGKWFSWANDDFRSRHRYRLIVADSLSKEERSERMSRVRNRDTKPEMVVRRLIHRMGFRYRLHDRRLPGAPDLVFKSRRKAIFIHGCFWHRHSDPNCKLARMPKSQSEFWRPKLEGNRQRDLRVQSELESIGWKHLIVWECELGHREQLENKLLGFLREGDSE
jgi:DNA mismatch endonuclease (patch repair protein)